MAQSEEGKSPVEIGHFQNEEDVITGDYAVVENPLPEQVKKPNTLSSTPTYEPKKKTATRTLEDQLRDSWLDEKILKNMGLKRCDGFAGIRNYHFFKDSESAIYFFEKHEKKDKKYKKDEYEYKLAFTVSPYGKG
jgi:hypothetical protein